MKLIFGLLFSLLSLNALAFPTAPFDALKFDVRQFNDSYLTNFNGYNFEAIVKLSNCSGSLVKFSGQPDTSPALVLTNGHCLGGGFIKPGLAVYNVPTQRRMKVADSNGNFSNIYSTRVIYGTMTGTDAALYELSETYKSIFDRTGVRALTMSYEHPSASVGIEIISGYWERGYSCDIDKFIYQLAEGGWIFTDSIKYSQPGCETIGGTSGSPIIAAGTRTVIGINNTGNSNGEKCTINNPCEVSQDGAVVVDEGASYGQQTYIFYSCLTNDYRIDLNLPQCALTK